MRIKPSQVSEETCSGKRGDVEYLVNIIAFIKIMGVVMFMW